MSDSTYDLYRQSCINLARSIILKSSETAAAINAELELLGVEVDQTNPSTWKYYLNLSGQYHPFDTPMTVTSLDTLEIIAFTRESLEIHRSTAKAYTFNSDAYMSLLSRYPEQETLIRGIVNPVELEQSIPADDWDILFYNDDLVETNEADLITRIQLWIKRHMLRWHISDYTISDDLYLAAALGVLYSHLPNAIMNIRLDNAKTYKAHSYHVWTYLASNGGLSGYRESLTTAQALFLYRNIRYIYKNSGKTSTFRLLIQNLLTERGLPLYAYDLRHRTDSLPDSIQPDIDVIRYPLNDSLVSADAIQIYTPDELTQLVDIFAPDNGLNALELTAEWVRKMQRSGRDRVLTKVVESVVEINDSFEAVNLNQLLLEHWAYLSNIGVYSGNITVVNPHSGNILQISAADAFILYLYLYNKTLGVTLTEIPTFTTFLTVEPVMQNWDEFTEGLDPDYVEPYHSMFRSLPTTSNIINAEGFFEHVSEVYHVIASILTASNLASKLEEKAALRILFNRLTLTRKLTLNEIESYDQWLFINDIDVEDISLSDAQAFMDIIVETATGSDASTDTTAKSIQAALVAILNQLTSYDINVVPTLLGQNAFSVDTNRFRISELSISGIHDDGDYHSTLRIKDAYSHTDMGRIDAAPAALRLDDTTQSYAQFNLNQLDTAHLHTSARSLGSIRVANVEVAVKEIRHD